MFKLLLLLLAVAGLHARPLQRLPNGKLNHEHGDNSVLKDVNIGMKPKKQIPVPAEFCRQGTEPSRRFLMDLNTRMRKHNVGEMNRRVSCLHARPLQRLPNGKLNHEHGDNSVLKDVNIGMKPKKQIPVPAEFCRQGTEPSRRFLMDLNTRMRKHNVGEMNRRVSLDEFRQGTENKLNILQELRSRHMMSPQNSVQSEKHEQRDVPAEVYRQGTEPSRNTLMDLNTGLLKEHRTQVDRRLAGSAKWAVVSEHEDIKSQESSELKENHRAAPVEDRRQGTEPSRRFLIDLNTGRIKEEDSEMNRRVSGFYNPPADEKRQGTEPSRRFLIDVNTGMLKHNVGEMNRRVSGFYNPAPYEMRMGTQNSQAALVDPRTGQLLPALTEMQRSTAPLDEFRQGTKYQPNTLQELRLSVMHKQPSRNTLMDLNTGLLKEHHSSAKWAVVSEYKDIKNQESSELKENHRAAPVEDRRQGTEPSRRFLIDLNTGRIKEEDSEMNRRVSGFYNPPADEKRQGTEPSRRFLIDVNTGMLKHNVGEMNRRVSGFYNPAAYEMRMGTQNSHAALVDPRTGQLLPALTEMQRSTAPLDEFRQGTEYQPNTLQELRLSVMHKQPSRNTLMDLDTSILVH